MSAAGIQAVMRAAAVRAIGEELCPDLSLTIPVVKIQCQ